MKLSKNSSGGVVYITADPNHSYHQFSINPLGAENTHYTFYHEVSGDYIECTRGDCSENPIVAHGYFKSFKITSPQPFIVEYLAKN